MRIKVVESGAVLGAEIQGVDLTRPIDEATFAEIREAFFRHEVIWFRGQEISADDQIRLSANFGILRRLKRTTALHPTRPEIFLVSNILDDEGKPVGLTDAGLFWHTDGAYLEDPPLVSIIRAIEVPMRDGRALGDTEFSSMTAAYDALPESMKKRLEGLNAVQSIVLRYARTEAAGIRKPELNTIITSPPSAVHPVVRPHPVTGRKCLFVSEAYTERILGLPDDESRDLISELANHSIQERFRYRHSYRVNDLLLWDDNSTQHKATFDYRLPERRLMHRTTVGQTA